MAGSSAITRSSPGRYPALVDCLGYDLDRRLVRLQRWRKPAFVPHAGSEPAIVQDVPQRVEDFGAHSQPFAERCRANGHDHELLHVDARAQRMLAAVEDVHHRHRQRARVRTSEIAVKRQTGPFGSGPGDCQRDAEDRVRAQSPLVWRAIDLDHQASRYRADRAHSCRRRSVRSRR